jgi:ABC-type thiamin/hydroxymethylpyrimidine transport system permease subunit
MGPLVPPAKKVNPTSSRDLLIVAVLSGIGGVMSTYVGYLGNLLNRVFGVPFGAGQFVSGLHVFWIILAAGIVRRPGAATATGLLKGVVELLTGSTHGLVIVLVSLVQGLLVDLVLLLLRRHNLWSYALAGGVAAASNVFVFQILYFSGAPLAYILFISGLAFISGILFAGFFGRNVLEVIAEARPFRMGVAVPGPPAAARGGKAPSLKLNFVITGLLVLALSAGAVYYFAVIFDPPWKGPGFSVEGAVERAGTFQLSHFSSHETTITAELIGQVTYVPPREYTGIPVKAILAESRPQPGATTLSVLASDGYQADFPLEDVLGDGEMVLILEDGNLRLIAGNYPGGHWVKLVTRLIVK